MPDQAEVSVELEFKPDGTFGIGFGIKAPLQMPKWRGRDNRLPQEDEMLADMIRRAGEYKKPDVSAFAVGGYWRNLQEQPVITAVVSGKGGVGKTSIALGLCEFYSCTDKVLLVDFDLHNRGLTSKYGPLNPGNTTVLDEMRRFSKTVLVNEELPRESGRINLTKLESELFHKLRATYCYAGYPKIDVLSPLTLSNLYSREVELQPVVGSAARPASCFFLPSRRGGETYLGTPESRFDVAEIAMFLTYLAHLAHRNGITRVILDCHGAHDLAMVGAILASKHLVIVTRPESAAFEGTIELVRFAQSIVESELSFPSSRVLVFNEFRDADRKIAETLFEAVYREGDNAGDFEKIPRVHSSDKLRDLLKYYSAPSLLQSELIGPALRSVGDSSYRRDAVAGR